MFVPVVPNPCYAILIKAELIGFVVVVGKRCQCRHQQKINTRLQNKNIIY
jgi:hypothetical protein